MRHSFYAILGVAFVLASCAGGRGTSPVNSNNTVIDSSAKDSIVGGDRDSHGCIASAGYTWCQVQGKCVRLWEDGIKMENVNSAENKDGAKFNSYLLFSSDSLRVELFDNKLEKPLILKRTTSKPNIWSEGAVSIKNINGKWIVLNGDKIINIEVK